MPATQYGQEVEPLRRFVLYCGQLLQGGRGVVELPPSEKEPSSHMTQAAWLALHPQPGAHTEQDAADWEPLPRVVVPSGVQAVQLGRGELGRPPVENVPLAHGLQSGPPNPGAHSEQLEYVVSGAVPVGQRWQGGLGWVVLPPSETRPSPQGLHWSPP